MELNNEAKRVLKYIYKHPYVPYIGLACIGIRGVDLNNIDDILTTLMVNEFISCRSAQCKAADSEKKEVTLSSLDGHLVTLPTGDTYIENKKRKLIFYWMPIIIDSFLSIAAIIISIIALLS